MKQDANQSFQGMARLPAKGTYRNDFNAVGIFGMHSSAKMNIKRYILTLASWEFGIFHTTDWRSYQIRCFVCVR
jgi:hypothetical protein